MSLYALFNFYIWFIAYMYAPSLDFSSPVKNGVKDRTSQNISDAEKERQKIMNEFYLSEMPKDEDEEALTKSTSSSINMKRTQNKERKPKPAANPYK